MIHRAGQICICERDAAKRRASQGFSRRGLPVDPKEKPGLRIQIRVSPAIQNDSCDIALCIEASGSEHDGELLADSSFVIAEGSGQHLSAAAMPLFFGGHPG